MKSGRAGNRSENQIAVLAQNGHLQRPGGSKLALRVGQFYGSPALLMIQGPNREAGPSFSGDSRSFRSGGRSLSPKVPERTGFTHSVPRTEAAGRQCSQAAKRPAAGHHGGTAGGAARRTNGARSVSCSSTWGWTSCGRAKPEAEPAPLKCCTRPERGDLITRFRRYGVHFFSLFGPPAVNS